jgi:hypothetical protein
MSTVSNLGDDDVFSAFPELPDCAGSCVRLAESKQIANKGPFMYFS